MPEGGFTVTFETPRPLQSTWCKISRGHCCSLVHYFRVHCIIALSSWRKGLQTFGPIFPLGAWIISKTDGFQCGSGKYTPPGPSGSEPLGRNPPWPSASGDFDPGSHCPRAQGVIFPGTALKTITEFSYKNH